MSVEDDAKNELINHIISLMVEPNVRFNDQSEDDISKYNAFISDVKSNKNLSVKLPLEFALHDEMFNLIKTGKVFLDNSVKFVATFTTDHDSIKYEPTQLDAKYTGNEFNYSFLDNHPGIINVDSIKDIPTDYEGLMAVPVTVLNCRNISKFCIYRVIYMPKHLGKYIYPRVVVTNKFAA